MTYEQAACLPVALQTMHNAVVTAGRLKPGDTLLMQGASSGVGLMGMQIGKLMGASLVHRHLDQPAAPGAARNSAATSRSIPATRNGRKRSGRRPATRVSTSLST